MRCYNVQWTKLVVSLRIFKPLAIYMVMSYLVKLADGQYREEEESSNGLIWFGESIW